MLVYSAGNQRMARQRARRPRAQPTKHQLHRRRYAWCADCVPASLLVPDCPRFCRESHMSARAPGSFPLRGQALKQMEHPCNRHSYAIAALTAGNLFSHHLRFPVCSDSLVVAACCADWLRYRMRSSSGSSRNCSGSCRSGPPLHSALPSPSLSRSRCVKSWHTVLPETVVLLWISGCCAR